MPKIHVLAARLDALGGLVAATVEDMWAWNHGESWGNAPLTVQDDEWITSPFIRLEFLLMLAPI